MMCILKLKWLTLFSWWWVLPRKTEGMRHFSQTGNAEKVAFHYYLGHRWQHDLNLRYHLNPLGALQALDCRNSLANYTKLIHRVEEGMWHGRNVTRERSVQYPPVMLHTDGSLFIFRSLQQIHTIRKKQKQPDFHLQTKAINCRLN